MNIVGLQSIIYGVEDVDLATRFQEDWGLELVEKGKTGSSFRLPDNTSVDIRSVGDENLPPPTVLGSTAREVIWGAADKDTLEAIGAELSKDRKITVDSEGGLHSHDDLGYRIGFRVTTRDVKPLTFPDSNTVGNASRVDQRADVFARRGPVKQQRMSHVVYWAPQAPAAAAEFYLNRLGFKLTESLLGKNFFMRCGGSNDHHNLFLENGGNKFGFQHAAYEVRDSDEVLKCGTYMEEKGWQSQLGPGRHYFGSGWFWYFWNPAGGLIETGFDSDFISADWEPLHHETIPPEAGRPWMVRRDEIGKSVAEGDWPQVVNGNVLPTAG